MKFFKITIFVFFALYILSCGKNDQNDDEQQAKPIEKTAIPQNIKQTHSKSRTKNADSIKAVKRSIFTNKTYKKKEVDSTMVHEKTPIAEIKKVATEAPRSNKFEQSFFYIKKILADCKVGETVTQKDLSKNYNIPKDAIKLVKSIKKVSDNEIDVKWKSSWLIEKVSDAKLKDGILKVNFKDNKMYTSGDAIGIKYDDKMYTNLVITGHIARIPTVKGFYWQIGKE